MGLVCLAHRNIVIKDDADGAKGTIAIEAYSKHMAQKHGNKKKKASCTAKPSGDAPPTKS